MSAPESSAPVEATVRRVPRYGVFMALGAVLGIIAAGIITMTGSYEPSTALNVVYPPGQVFGFALLWMVPIGIGLGGLVAILLERIARRHDRVVRVDRETIVAED
ncbi:potassium transporter Trk [Microbacterium sp. GXF6406]